MLAAKLKARPVEREGESEEASQMKFSSSAFTDSCAVRKVAERSYPALGEASGFSIGLSHRMQ